MPRRPLIVGAVVALVGVALVLLWTERGADAETASASAVTAATAPPAAASPTSVATPRPSRTTPVEPSETPDQPSEPADPDPSTSAPVSPAPRTAEPPPPPPGGVTKQATLRIPGIGLRAGLHAEGLRNGAINPPRGTVMWFTGHGRVAPGAVGTSVIAGHVVAGGRPDVFADLSQVRVGDRVELVGGDGQSRTFRVVRAGVVAKNDLTTDQKVWGPNSSVRRLAIITCDDAYGFRRDGHRVANYVVIAEPA